MVIKYWSVTGNKSLQMESPGTCRSFTRWTVHTGTWRTTPRQTRSGFFRRTATDPCRRNPRSAGTGSSTMSSSLPLVVQLLILLIIGIIVILGCFKSQKWRTHSCFIWIFKPVRCISSENSFQHVHLRDLWGEFHFCCYTVRNSEHKFWEDSRLSFKPLLNLKQFVTEEASRKG